MLKRSPVRYPNVKNFWDIPGGRIIPGTALAENVRREVFEETRLAVNGDMILVDAQDIIRLPEKHIVRITFSASTSGEPILNEEHLEHNPDAG